MTPKTRIKHLFATNLLGWAKAQGSLLRFCDRQQQPTGRDQDCYENVKVIKIVKLAKCLYFKKNVVHYNCPSPLDQTESLFHSFASTLEIISKFNVGDVQAGIQVCQFLEKGWSVKSSSAKVLCQGIKIDLIITVIEIPQAVHSVLIEKSSRSQSDQSLVLPKKKTLLEESNKSFLNIPSSYKIWQPPLGGDTRWS